jgi:hypothetical protein
MTINPQYGRTSMEHLAILPELEFDFSEDQPASVSLGKTDVAVKVLPEMLCEMDHSQSVPVLQLSISLRPGALPADAALDVVRLCALLDRLERSYSGAGLTPDDTAWETAANGSCVRICFKPAQPADAMDRLARLVGTINSATAKLLEAEVLPYRSIEHCEAQVILPAA